MKANIQSPYKYKEKKMSDRKVYVLSKGGHDYTDAERFGKLVFLDVPSFARWDINRLYRELEEGLQDANKDDLFIISHLASHCAVAASILTEWFGQVNFLIYRKDKYEEHKLILNPEVD